MGQLQVFGFAFSTILALSTPIQGRAGIESAGQVSHQAILEIASGYQTLKEWKKIAAVDEELQKVFLQHLESKGFKNRITKISFKTPTGNALPSLGAVAEPLTGLVVTHSMDEEKGKKNNVIRYLENGYNSIGIDKSGNIFIRGHSFVRTQEEFVKNLSSINLTFDVNAEEGEQLNSAQIATAAEIAEALQKAFKLLKTGVQVQFKDHHDKGLKEGKKYFEAGSARDSANARLKTLAKDSL